MLVTRQLMDPIDFHSKNKNKYNGSQWAPSTVRLPTYYKYLLLCSTEETHTGLEQQHI